jgi:histidinol phosphatase-like PHP family hydrolase
LATCEGCPQWFSDGIYEVLALKLGIEIPEVPANGQPTPQQWNEYNALVKGYTLENMTALEESIRKSQGVDVRSLTGKQLDAVIASIKGKKGTK